MRVSEVSLGGWLTQGRSIDDDTTDRIVQKALELGINFFDTADVYNRGEAELSLGKALKDVRRSDVVIGTKCFFPMSDLPNDRGLSRKHITESVHASLKRLQTDYVDMMQFHRFDAETPFDETVRAVDDLIRAGKVLYWGVSEWSAQQIDEVVGVAKSINANPPASNQPIYNMLTKGIEDGVIQSCENHGIGLVVFSPLAQGILTGKYLPGQPPPSGSRGADDTSNMFMTGMLEEDTLNRVQKLKEFANGHGYSIGQFALAWCLRQKQVSSVIIGATKPEHVEMNAAASGIELPAEVWQEAEAILSN
jgi:aryl-alcohol dehydrogenase-like predicted oxidoreductase